MQQKPKKKQVIKQSTVQSIDNHTGEVLSVINHETFYLPQEPEFVKLYLEDIERFYSLNQSHSKLLNALLKHMSYTNLVILLKPVKDILCAELKMPLNTLNKAIESLANQNILIRKARSVYIVDPSLFGKGKWEDIHSIRMSITYDRDNKKTIKTDIIKNSEVKLKQLQLNFDFEDENKRNNQG